MRGQKVIDVIFSRDHFLFSL